MDCFYFKIKIAKTVENPLLKQNIDTQVLKYVILPNVTTNNELHYVKITNDWMTLNKYGILKCAIT